MYVVSVKSTVKIFSIFVVFLENINFNFSKHYYCPIVSSFKLIIVCINTYMDACGEVGQFGEVNVKPLSVPASIGPA